jgi:uncharacterized coiled-coil DUF342 family protein
MITKEELEKLIQKKDEILEKVSQTQDRDERKKLHAEFDKIFMKINDITKNIIDLQIEEDFKKRGIDPYSPCPTCGKTILEKRK